MRNLAGVLAALVVSSGAVAQPTLDCVAAYAGNGIYGSTFTVHGNDGEQRSFFADMTYEGAHGGQIQQILVGGLLEIHNESDADSLNGLGEYVKVEDSWFGDPFALLPRADIIELTEGPNSYHIASGTGGGSQYEDAKHAYIACTGPVAYDGVISRTGQNYPVGGVCTPQAGDANLDGCTDGLDYVIWSNNYEPFVGGKTWGQGDLNCDEFTDGLDYVVWSNSYLQGCPSLPGPVPEPTGLLLVALGSLALLRRRSAQVIRRRR